VEVTVWNDTGNIDTGPMWIRKARGVLDAPFGVALDRVYEIMQQLEDGHECPGMRQ